MSTHRRADPVDRVVLDRFTRLAAQILEAPVVCASLVDDHRQCLVTSCGLWPPSPAVVSPAAMKRMVASAPHVDMDLRGSDGRLVGTLMMMSRDSTDWTSAQTEFLKELAVRLVAHVDIGPSERVM